MKQNEIESNRMEDEFKGITSEFVGLKSKMYSLFTVGNEKIKT